MKIYFFLFVLCSHVSLFALKPHALISEKPIKVVYTPDSILTAPPGKPIYAADKKRYSTCPGITWAGRDNYLITANYLAKFVGVFKYTEEENSCELVYKLGNLDGMQLDRVADVSISKDGKIVAIGNSGTKLNIYEIANPDSCVIHPIPKKILGELPNQRMHGVSFSSNSKYLSYTTIDDPDQICIYRMDRSEEGELQFTLTQKLQNLFHPMKPKSIAFSPDDQFVAICFSERSQRYVAHNGILASFMFDNETGRIYPVPISVTPEGGGIGLVSPEGICFAMNGTALLTTDQVVNIVTMHEFDAKKGTIGKGSIILKNPEAELNFPHGISVSSEGNRIAVSNLGDDKINIYSLDIMCNLVK